MTAFDTILTVAQIFLGGAVLALLVAAYLTHRRTP
jgi:hypothetical protein